MTYKIMMLSEIIAIFIVFVLLSIFVSDFVEWPTYYYFITAVIISFVLELILKKVFGKPVNSKGTQDTKNNSNK